MASKGGRIIGAGKPSQKTSGRVAKRERVYTRGKLQKRTMKYKKLAQSGELLNPNVGDVPKKIQISLLHLISRLKSTLYQVGR
jgi:hypothetical protein